MKDRMVEEPIDTVPMAHDRPEKLPLVFTGSGSEYFRIWIVNLLLVLVTLGIYFPWAKVRKLRYFYGNTLVGGEPLGFHGEPWKMLKGYALVAVLFACYSAAGKVSPSAGFVALLVVAGLWPALLKASMQFRLANTSWRGLRFRFTGDLMQAYKAVVPLFVPGALILGFIASAGVTPAEQAESGIVVLWLALGATAVFPWLLWLLKKYQHSNLALGAEQTRLSTGVWSFYKLGLKVLAMYLALVLVVGLVVLVPMLVGGLVFMSADGKLNPQAMALAAFWIVPVGFILFVGLTAYGTARAQNLIWNHTASNQVQFQSHLRVRSLFWLNIKNWLLTALTLGLYWPFATVATRRLRLQAVSISLSLDAEQLLVDSNSHAGDAAGDAAGDFFGFDIGL
jgi:uncharacterized membrane protein YjgN (DUF898 family)